MNNPPFDYLLYFFLTQYVVQIPATSAKKLKQIQYAFDIAVNCLKWDVTADFVMGEKRLMARYDGYKFAIVHLERSEAEEVRNFAESLEDDLEALFDIFQDDHVKLSLTFVKEREAWCCSLTPQSDNSFNDKVVMTSWSNIALEAIWISGYKHVVKCNRKEYPTEEKGGVWG